MSDDGDRLAYDVAWIKGNTHNTHVVVISHAKLLKDFRMFMSKRKWKRAIKPVHFIPL